MPAPRFTTFRASSSTASRIKQHVKSKNTKAELHLRSALHQRGLRFRLHRTDLPGKPDIVFPSRRVAVFVDGDYWHGRDWARRKRKLAAGSNSEYWISKIRANMKRDRKQNLLLARAGWLVIRLWETDVLRDPGRTAELVADIINRQKKSLNGLRP